MSQSEDVRALIMAPLAKGVSDARQRFEPESGRFLAANRGWAVTNQDVIYPLALLYTEPHPANPLAGSDEILNLCSQGGDALRERQDEEGKFEFVKIDGSRWGRILMPWSLYHWLEAYALLEEDLAQSRSREWEDGLRLAYTGVADLVGRSEAFHNILTWHAMALVRAGRVFGEPAWRSVGEDYILRAAESQHPDGYWAEGGVPTTGYNLVYIHAIGLYFHFTQDERVLPCLERALNFHLLFTYPDGSAVETIDGRVRYSNHVLRHGYPGFCLFPAGRRFVRYLVQRWREQAPAGELSPHFASAYVHWQEGEEDAIPQEMSDFQQVHGERALVLKKGNWFCCLGACLTPDEDIARTWLVRWRRDQTNFLSVWHQRAGLLIGGGNSNNQPEFNTFVVVSRRRRYMQPDTASLEGFSNGGLLQAAYGPLNCSVRIGIASENSLTIEFSAEGEKPSLLQAAFHLRLKAGQVLACDDGTTCTFDPLRSGGVGWDDGREHRIRSNGWTLVLPPGASITAPVYPFNPYAIDDRSGPDQAVARVAVHLEPDEPPKRFRLLAE